MSLATAASAACSRRPRLTSDVQLTVKMAVAYAYLISGRPIADLAAEHRRSARTIQLWVNQAAHMPGPHGDYLRWMLANRPH